MATQARGREEKGRVVSPVGSAVRLAAATTRPRGINGGREFIRRRSGDRRPAEQGIHCLVTVCLDFFLLS